MCFLCQNKGRRRLNCSFWMRFRAAASPSFLCCQKNRLDVLSISLTIFITVFLQCDTAVPFAVKGYLLHSGGERRRTKESGPECSELRAHAQCGQSGLCAERGRLWLSCLFWHNSPWRRRHLEGMPPQVLQVLFPSKQDSRQNTARCEVSFFCRNRTEQGGRAAKVENLQKIWTCHHHPA